MKSVFARALVAVGVAGLLIGASATSVGNQITVKKGKWNLVGLPATGNDVNLSVVVGANAGLVGGIFAEINATAVKTAGLQTSKYFRYTFHNLATTMARNVQMKPGVGYWLYVPATTTAQIGTDLNVSLLTSYVDSTNPLAYSPVDTNATNSFLTSDVNTTLGVASFAADTWYLLSAPSDLNVTRYRTHNGALSTALAFDYNFTNSTNVFWTYNASTGAFEDVTPAGKDVIPAGTGFWYLP